MVYAHTLNVFAVSSFGAFAIVQSRAHESWARLFGSSMKDDLRYTSSDCFDTFPFPSPTGQLEHLGKEYYEYRAGLMVRTNQGLTATYNRFHDRDERAPDVARLRELHSAMDRAVLDAYEWSDIATDCDFFPETEDDAEEEATDVGPRKKIRYRYRWPDDVRDEVLARLLELNRQRAEEERLLAAEEERSAPKKAKKGARSRAPKAKPPMLF
jgi:hypothetical protein